ncbi:MAG: response regulator [Gammaproteobacteria bacterium]|nr:MAG: response regulator [Gammaproteobacteria bacterium]
MSKILMVDDSPTEIHVVKEMLISKGHTVVTASNGEEGIAMAKSEQPDLILMDIVMPGMNGFKATRTISKDPETSSIPIIMLSSKDQTTDMEWAKRQGAKGYVVKPVDENELMTMVNANL